MFPFTRDQLDNYIHGNYDELTPETIQAIKSNYKAAVFAYDPFYVAVSSFLSPHQQQQGVVAAGVAPIHIIRVIPPEPKATQTDTLLARDVVLAVLRSVTEGQTVDSRILACIIELKLVTIPGFNQQRLNSQVANRRTPCPGHCSDKAPRLSTPFNKDAMGIFVMQNPRKPDLPLRLRRCSYKLYMEYSKNLKNSEYIDAIATIFDTPDPELDGVDLEGPKLNLHKHLHDELWSWSDTEKKLLAFSTGCDCGMPNRLFVLDPATEKMVLKTF